MMRCAPASSHVDGQGIGPAKQLEVYRFGESEANSGDRWYFITAIVVTMQYTVDDRHESA